MFVNTQPRYEILSEDAMAMLDKGWKRLVTEIGIEFASPWATEMLAAAGQKVDGLNVKFDPEWVLAQVAKAPSEYQVHARNPENTVTIEMPGEQPPTISVSTDETEIASLVGDVGQTEPTDEPETSGLPAEANEAAALASSAVDEEARLAH